MSKPKTGPQDLPPKGGYAPFQINRVKLGNYFKGPWPYLAYLATNLYAMRTYHGLWQEKFKEKLANRGNELIIRTLIHAENDRNILRFLKEVRTLEEDVMKDFPYWETGTYLGEPIFKTLPEDTYVRPRPADCFAFMSYTDIPLGPTAHHWY